MPNDSHSQAILTTDAARRGTMEADQLMLGYAVGRGIEFPDPVGPVLLMRRKVYPGAIEDWGYAGEAHPDAGTIVNGNGTTHGVSSGYEYTAVRAFGNGFIGRMFEPTRVDFDGAGDIITPALPTWPRGLHVMPSAGGKFLVSWVHVDWGEGEPPTDYQIFEGATAATINYGAAIATVVHDGHQEEYTHETGVYTNGTKHAFAVRARNSGGVAELNEITSDVLAAENATPPAAVITAAALSGQGGLV